MSADAEPIMKYPLINALYDAMVAAFRANKVKDDYIHTSPLGALEAACVAVIGDSPEKFLAIVQEGIRLFEDGDLDSPESNHTWGMAILEGVPERDHLESYNAVVEILFHAAMSEMLRQRNPELIEEARRKSAEWDARQAGGAT